MNNYNFMYWLTRLDHIQDFITGSLVFLWIFISVVLFIGFLQFDAFEKPYPKWVIKTPIWCFIIVIILYISSVFIPTKNEMILISLGGKTMDFVQSDTSLQKIPYQSTKIITDYLDRSIKELNTQK